nr:hypothetical protein [Candidatus Sigynarchaeota archaeon]MDO8113272.1 hypothetical protein [Candidatus Sigynarchaeota archaeon]
MTANIDHYCLFCGKTLRGAEPHVRKCVLGGECCKTCAAACALDRCCRLK